jgi:hypothetical protein
LENGYVSIGERRRLCRMQDRASKHIYRAKHNKVSHYVYRPTHRHHNFLHRPLHYGLHARGFHLGPAWSFGWSAGWR